MSNEPISNELVINATPTGQRIVLLQDKKIVEYHEESQDTAFAVGDIYWGVVRKVLTGLNAAFVDIGHEKDAFLPYSDLGTTFNSLQKFVKSTLSNKQTSPRLQNFELAEPLEKFGNMSKMLQKNNMILVQVIKEPISNKGPRICCELTLAGRYMVLVPFSESISISKKISDRDERNRLQRLMTSIKPKNFGLIIRTVAEGVEVAELDKDLQELLQKWETGMKLVFNAKPKQRIIGELSRTSSLLRDLLNESFDNITVDNKDLYEELREYVRNIAPQKEKIVKFHNPKSQIFEVTGIEKQLKFLFGKTVSLPNGGYLIIEHTEALHVIDVNSGNKSSSNQNQEENSVSVNMDAVEEIARQLRIRDMGGIIVVDFIDMRKADNKRLLYEKMRQLLKLERARTTVLPISKFGILQITRQRVRPEINLITREACPACNGTGNVSASILVSDVIESQLIFLLSEQNEKKMTLRLHPYLYAFFKQGWYSKQMQWYWTYWTWVKLVKDTSLALNQWTFVNSNGEVIEMNSQNNKRLIREQNIAEDQRINPTNEEEEIEEEN